MRISLLSLLGLGIAHANEGGMKAMGMGGALVAFPQEAVAIAFNPATATEMGRRFDIGVMAQGWTKSLTVSNRQPLFEFVGQGKYNADGNVGVFTDGGLVGWAPCHIALGVAWNNQEYISTHYKVPLNDFGGFDRDSNPAGSKVSMDYRMDTVSFVVAYPINCCHTIGFGINLNIASFRVSGLENLKNFSVEPNFVTNNGTDFSTGGGVTFGWLGQLCPGLTMGVAYISECSMESFGRYKGLLPAHHRIQCPNIWEVGIAYEYNCCLTFAADVEYRRYRHDTTWRNPFPASSDEPLGTLFGSSDGPGFGWRNQTKFRLGGQWQCHPDWVVRAGYRYERTPIRGKGADTALNVLTLNTVQNYFTLGSTYYINACSEVSLFAEYGLEEGIRSHYPQVFGGLEWAAADLLFRSQSYAAGFAYGIAF